MITDAPMQTAAPTTFNPNLMSMCRSSFSVFMTEAKPGGGGARAARGCGRRAAARAAAAASASAAARQHGSGGEPRGGRMRGSE